MYLQYRSQGGKSSWSQVRVFKFRSSILGSLWVMGKSITILFDRSLEIGMSCDCFISVLAVNFHSRWRVASNE